MDENSLNRAIEGSTYVIHTAAPIIFAAENEEEELIKPIVGATEAVMKACKTHGVRRCVITATLGNVIFGYAMDDPERPTDSVFDERHFTKAENLPNGGIFSYMKAKALAEKAAWDYHA